MPAADGEAQLGRADDVVLVEGNVLVPAAARSARLHSRGAELLGDVGDRLLLAGRRGPAPQELIGGEHAYVLRQACGIDRLLGRNRWGGEKQDGQADSRESHGSSFD